MQTDAFTSEGNEMKTYHEHSRLVPYCDVKGTYALRSQMAGMSPLKAVEFVSGIENSKRKTFRAPEKPSRYAIPLS